MVRFKSLTWEKLQGVFEMSQFHYGSIQMFAIILSSKPPCRVSIPLWFDSNYYNYRILNTTEIVSIPLWFDSNNWMLCLYSQGVRSQFHYGSIQIEVHSIIQYNDMESQFHYGSIQIKLLLPYQHQHSNSLNSTMVRFKLNVDLCDIRAIGYVSIPLWFDSNPNMDVDSNIGNIGSQFHYGSIQISSSLTTRLRLVYVSIPLWFDSNGCVNHLV